MIENIFEELEWRGLVYDYTEGLPELLTKERVTAYIGFDPTSDSLQIGNLLTLMGLARLQRFGHTPIAVAGGGTGMIGDPSGKSHERQLLKQEEVEANVEAIQSQLGRFLDFKVKGNPAQIQNNSKWLMPVTMMEFLRDVGKYFTVNYMTAKDSVKMRLQSAEGISFTEFSYMLLQAYDFLYLFDNNQCKLQLGGSDQWGNITAGIELIRRVRAERAFGLVWPLITTADGSKLGKTEKGTIWLSAERTSPYRFYQFWLNRDDSDVIKYLKYFTWLEEPQIKELEQEVSENPEQRRAQRTLAQEMTRMVHDGTALARAEQASKVLFGGEITGLGAGEIQEIFADVPSSNIQKSVLKENGMNIVDLLAENGVAKSKGEARRLIENGGAYINNRRIEDTEQNITLKDTIEEQFVVLRKGKKNYHLLQIQQRS